MKFYDEISKYYKYIFPLSETTLSFLGESLPKDEKILDIACGSGEYTIGLKLAGYDVLGVDLDSLMIEKAKEKASEEKVDIEFKVGNILKLEEIFEEDFGGMFCIGNSLVHLDTIEEIEAALKQMKNKVKEDGTLIIQIINYSRILKFNLEGLPTIKNEEMGIEFVRNYVKKENKIFFNTILKTKGNDDLENTVELLPITHDKLVDMLTNVGFKDIELFGGFNGIEFDEDNSMALIIKCRK